MSDASKRTARGFTLLEVMVSMAILAVSLVAILDLHSGGVRMHNHAKFLTVATMLARSKMVDVEEKLYKDGLPDFDETDDGTFEDEGYPNFKWKAEIVKPDIEVDTNDLVGVIMKQLGMDPAALADAGSGSGPADKNGISTVGGMGGIESLVAPMAQQLVPQIESSVREVRLTVSWKDITGPSQFTVATHVIKLPQQQGVPGGSQDVAAHKAASDLGKAQDAAATAADGATGGGYPGGFMRPTSPGGAGDFRPPVITRPPPLGNK